MVLESPVYFPDLKEAGADHYDLETLQSKRSRSSHAYTELCSARRCQAKPTVIVRAFDSYGRPAKQYELCSPHGLYIAKREKRKGRGVIFLLD
jgi:hypothetical protein